MPRDPAEMRQRREQRVRLMQVVGLTEALGLSTQDALRVDETIRRFDERRRPLKDQIREAGKVVTEAARGDNSALAQVDQATNRLLDARIQLASLDKEMFQTLARDMGPQQRARLALFYARFVKGMKGFKARGLDGEGNEGRRFKMLRMKRGQRFGEADAPAAALGAVLAEGAAPAEGAAVADGAADGFTDE